MTATGDNIRHARESAGLSQYELGQRSAIPQPTISAWEKGRTWPTIPLLMRVAHALYLPAGSLLPPGDRPAEVGADHAGRALRRLDRLAIEARQDGLTPAGVTVMAELAAADLRLAMGISEEEQ